MNDLAHAWGLGEALSKQEALFAWRQAVGAQLAHWARPLYVSSGVLHLAVGSYVAASQLRLLEPKLVDALRQTAPECGVSRLRLHVEPERPPRREAGEAEATREDVSAAEELVPEDLPADLRKRLLSAAARAQAQERGILRAGGQRCSSCEVAFLGEERLCPLCSLVGEEKSD